jgi:TonB family protein
VKKGRKASTIKAGNGTVLQVVDVEQIVKNDDDQSSDVEIITIKGKVFDIDDKSPIVGAVVKVAGSTKGAVTDKEGNFSLETSVGARIEVMYVGYETYSVGISKAYAKDREYMIALNKEGSERNNGQVFDVVETMPQFPGGAPALFEFLSKNIKYPAEAEKADKQGRVIVTFVVGKDGSISDARVVKSVDPLLDAEALRVINAMPNWTPGTQSGRTVNVKYTVPITFRLDGGKETPKVNGTAQSEENSAASAYVIGYAAAQNGFSAEQKPLIIADGKTIDIIKMKEIDPKTIETMTVLKDKAAISQYGEKAKDGVIVITTKK